MFRVYSFKLKTPKDLEYLANSVNLIWNYCNRARFQNIKKYNKFLHFYDLQKLTAGTSKDLNLNSRTIQLVCKELVQREQQFKKIKLRWRSKRSLGWVPFDGVRLKKDIIIYNGKHYKIWKHREIKGVIKCGNFSQNSKGHWFVNLICELKEENISKDNSIGIDLGLKDLATLSNGEIIENPKYYRKLENKLVKAQRAKKKKQIKNIHFKIKNQRKDYLHKISDRITKENNFIVIGGIKSTDLVKTNMAKSVYDVSWYSFKNMLKYKAIARGGICLEVNEAYTTKTCSNCGSLSGPSGIKDLSIREWTCDCGAKHNRDVNAAINILRLGHQTPEGNSKKEACH